jgi:hypothetical protein
VQFIGCCDFIGFLLLSFFIMKGNEKQLKI